MIYSRRRVLRILRRLIVELSLLAVGVTLGALALSYLLAGEIYDYKDTVDTSDLPVVDAIVCLGGGRGRISAAGDLWYRYWEHAQDSKLSGSTPVTKVPVLYFSGMGHQATWAVLSKQLKKGVLEVIHSENVVIENESSNTDTNAQWLSHYARQKHWKRILLLTSSYHMKRALFIFNHILNNHQTLLEIETYSVYQEPFGLEEWRTGPNGIRVTLMEYLKWVYYRSIWSSF